MQICLVHGRGGRFSTLRTESALYVFILHPTCFSQPREKERAPSLSLSLPLCLSCSPYVPPTRYAHQLVKITQIHEPGAIEIRFYSERSTYQRSHIRCMRIGLNVKRSVDLTGPLAIPREWRNKPSKLPTACAPLGCRCVVVFVFPAIIGTYVLKIDPIHFFRTCIHAVWVERLPSKPH